MNLEDYIKDLAPDLQEQARACDSVEELLALAKEAKIPLPDEALKAIAGGDEPEPVNCTKSMPHCPNCGSKNVVYDMIDLEFVCNDCGFKWY